MHDEIISNSEEETLRWAENLGRGASAGGIFALYGELGSGKTIIAKGIARGMGIVEEITSPTFLLMEVYENTLPLFHFDLYRIEDDREFDSLNFEEYWGGGGVSVIEWAEKAGDRLPDGAVKIRISWEDENRRRIKIEHPRD